MNQHAQLAGRRQCAAPARRQRCFAQPGPQPLWPSPAQALQPQQQPRRQQQQQQQQQQQAWRSRAECRCQAAAGNGGELGNGSESDGSSVSSSKLRFNKDLPLRHHNPEGVDHLAPTELPEHLRDLKLGDDGLLVDGKTGRVVNSLGATRFDVKMAALRGDLDPKPWEENTERAPGVLMQSLVTFPADYTFQVVGGVAGGCPDGTHAAFVDDAIATVARITETSLPLPEAAVSRRPRLNGKFVSVSITVRVRGPEIVHAVCGELAKDPRVKMAF